MASTVSDDENPMFLKKPKKVESDEPDIWGRNVPTSLAPDAGFGKSSGIFGAIAGFFKGLHPVVKVKDLNNPEGDDEGRPEHTAVEVGLGGTF